MSGKLARRTSPELESALLTLETAYAADPGVDAELASRLERDAEDIGRVDLALRAALVRGNALMLQGDKVAAGRIAHAVYARAVALDDSYLLARSHRALSVFFRQMGDNATALTHALQCMAHTPDDAPPAARIRHLMSLGTILDDTGSPDEAMRRFTEALSISTAHGNAELTVHLLNNLAYTAYGQGNRAEAEAHVARLREVAARHAVPLTTASLDTIARVAAMAGAHAEAERILAPLLAGNAQFRRDEGHGLVEVLLTVASAQFAQGAADRAQSTLDRAVELCDDEGLASFRAQIREQQALLHEAAGRYREAYEEHRRFHNETRALQSAQRYARAQVLQAVFEAEDARRKSEQFRELAYRDPLTGLHNRRYVDERLSGLLAEASTLSVALVDLDFFKRVNDTFSHHTGDLVLQQVATILREASPDAAVVGRLGGEEFVLLLPDYDAAAGWAACEEVRRAVEDYAWAPLTGELPVTASIGLTTTADAAATPSTVLASADRNLYTAKRTGRNRVCADVRE